MIVSSTNANYSDWANLTEEEYSESKRELIETTLNHLDRYVPNIRKRIEVHMAQAQARAANSRVSMVDQSMTGLSMIAQSGVADTVQPPTIDLGSGSGRSILSASLQNVVTPARRNASHIPFPAAAAAGPMSA